MFLYFSSQDTSGIGTMFLQLTLIVFNGGMRTMVAPNIIEFAFRSWKSRSARSVRMLAALIAVIDLAVPCVATILSDNRCLQTYIVGTEVVTSQYSFEYCANSDLVNRCQNQKTIETTPSTF